MRSEFEELDQNGGSSRGCRWRRPADLNLSKGKDHYDTASWTWHHTHAGTACKKKSCNLEQYELQIEELVEKELNVFMAMFTEQVK